jgi:hypothetical protein
MATAKKPQQNADSPASEVVLAAPYAYYDEDEKLHAWSAGEVVRDAATIALLTERGAPLAQ